MAHEEGSKRRLDTHLGASHPSPMPRLHPALLTAAVAWSAPLPARAQAPEWAELWRVAAVPLAAPAPLASGPTGVFWNPAAVRDVGGLAGGLEVLQTSEVVSLRAVAGALTYRLGKAASVGLAAGRVSVADLVRTTSSPVSEEGEIPVFAQFLGAVAGTSVGPVALGAQVRLHDARLDVRSEDGVTVDLGVRIDALGPVAVAAATHFASPRLEGGPTTDYFAAAEYRLGTSRVWGEPAVVLVRYGLGVRGTGDVEHGVGGGLAFGDRLRVDAAFRRELAYDVAVWRFALGLAFRAGRYVIAAARGSGINEVGAAYRIGLSAGVLR